MDGGHAANVVFEQRVQVTCRVTDAQVLRFQRALVPEGTPQDERDGHEGQQGHLPSDGKENRANDDDGGSHLQQVVCTLVEEAFELIDVVVEDRQQVAFSPFIKPRWGVTQHAFEGRHAHVVLDALREVSPQDAVPVFEQGFERPDGDGDRREHQQLMPRVNDAEGSEQGVLLRHHDVNGDTDQQRRRKVPDFVEDGT